MRRHAVLRDVQLAIGLRVCGRRLVAGAAVVGGLREVIVAVVVGAGAAIGADCGAGGGGGVDGGDGGVGGGFWWGLLVVVGGNWRWGRRRWCVVALCVGAVGTLFVGHGRWREVS